ncbi:MAG: MarR family transcriptional regulator [Dehalococcoidia bacterium]|nr:MarR family transcriptional regulator [Dehalococcoidia bacterium]
MIEVPELTTTERRAAQWLEAHGASLVDFWASYNAISAGQILYSGFGEALRPLGLSYESWRILWVLALVRRSEPRLLAQTLWLSRPAVTSALNRLEEGGHIVRTRATNDRRLVSVEMTEAGAELLERGATVYISTLSTLMDALDDEEKQLLARIGRKFWTLNFDRTRKSAGTPVRVGAAVIGTAVASA